MSEVARFVDSLPPEVSGHISGLMMRHGYSIGSTGEGPHTNVLGHPLFHLPLWVDSATADRAIDPKALLDICVSSLFGYLSVRVEDDVFDGDWVEPEAAMMVSATLRVRHQTLLSKHVSESRFWVRYEEVWQTYAEAMLLERKLHEPSSAYDPSDYESVLGRSQPLEIPACAVLALKDQWELAQRVAELVRRLARATQIFDDFVDAPGDLAAGNFTLMVRELGGLEGAPVMLHGMVTNCDAIMAEVGKELDLAVGLAEELGIRDLAPWARERKQLMNRAATAMYARLFGGSRAP